MLASVLRTVVPVIVGVILGQAARLGFDLPQGWVTEVVTVALTTGYYAAGRWVEQTYPGIGRLLLSAGLSKRAPTYLPAEGSTR